MHKKLRKAFDQPSQIRVLHATADSIETSLPGNRHAASCQNTKQLRKYVKSASYRNRMLRVKTTRKSEIICK